jgi:hypothetical protein
MTQTTLDRRVITAREAEQTLGIPASTIRAWASQERIHAVSIDANRERWYRLADVIELRSTTQRRTRHTRPSRARCVERCVDIA